jgi:hypothetical protein
MFIGRVLGFTLALAFATLLFYIGKKQEKEADREKKDFDDTMNTLKNYDGNEADE